MMGIHRWFLESEEMNDEVCVVSKVKKKIWSHANRRPYLLLLLRSSKCTNALGKFQNISNQTHLPWYISENTTTAGNLAFG